MADNEPPEEISANSTELPWPDPSRPIISERPSYPGYQQGWPGELRRDPLPSERRRRRALAAAAITALLLVLVAVWLLWWR